MLSGQTDYCALKQTNYRLSILRQDWVFNNIAHRIRNGTPEFPSSKVHYYRFLITDNSSWNQLFFSDESNAKWKSSYKTTTSNIISNINVPTTGGMDILDGTPPATDPITRRTPAYVASATTSATRYKEAGVLTYTDAADTPRFPPVEMHIIQCRSYIYEETNIKDVGYDVTGTNTTGWGNLILKHKDQDNRPFLSAVFGTAGRWMITNLSAINYDTQSVNYGTNLTAFTEKTLNAHLNGRKEYAYPQTNIQFNSAGDVIPWGNEPADWRWEEGVFYNWYAATGRTYNLSDMNDEGNSTQTPLQGICPNGWYIPSDEEWTELEKVIHSDLERYSTYDAIDISNFGTPAWNPSWNTASQVFRGDPIDDSNVGHGGAMKNICPPNGGAFGYFIASRGYSKEPYLGGFNGILVGKIAGDEHGTPTSTLTQRDRAWNTIYWSSSQSSNLRAWFRGLEVREGGVDRSGWDKTFLVSVRCKKK